MYQAYHGVSSAQHQAHFTDYSGKGYRLISLSVYGDPGSAQYAAVWVQRGGAAWQATHGVHNDAYQAFINKWSAQGYVVTLVSATGSGDSAIFAAVMEQGVSGSWLARHGMTSGPSANAGTFQNYNASALNQHLVLKSFAMYGTASSPRYIAVWHANPNYVKWHIYPSSTAADYQTVFNAETQLPGYGLASYRPAYVAVSGDHMYCSVFKDDVVGAWSSKHGMTTAEYQAEFNAQNAKGFYPICVQGGGSGSGTRYAAIFAKQDIPSERHWSVVGDTVPSLAGIDAIMKTFMETNGVRAAQVAVGKNGTIKFSRGYTFAEAGYRATKPSDMFLLASLSKMFVEGAVQALYDSKDLHPGDHAYPLLGFSGPLDPRSNQITIQQLLDHMGGYNDKDAPVNFDPTYSMRKIGLSLSPAKVVTKTDVAKYMYARMLDFAPGANTKYSNYGYLLLTAVIEKVTKMGYYDYVKKQLLTPANIAEVHVMSTEMSGRTAQEAITEDQGMHPSPLHLNSALNVPDVYGGDSEIKDVGAGCAGMAASAQAIAKFIHLHAAYGNGGRSLSARSGSTPGSSTWGESRADGVDWSYTINTRDWPANTSQPLSNLATAIDTLLNTAAL